MVTTGKEVEGAPVGFLRLWHISPSFSEVQVVSMLLPFRGLLQQDIKGGVEVCDNDWSRFWAG
jgi:hypothetical protein